MEKKRPETPESYDPHIIDDVLGGGKDPTIHLSQELPDAQLHPIEYFPMIALVPMDIPRTWFNLTQVVYSSGETYEVRTIKEERSKQTADTMFKKVEFACELGANIICCSEYSFPEVHRQSLGQKLAKLAVDKAYIVAGSFVETNPPTVYNTSIIYTPNDSIILQHKISKGQYSNIRENIRTDDVLKIIHTKYGNLAVLICATALNSSVWLKIRDTNRKVEKEGIDIVLIPAYTEKPIDFIQGCSFLDTYAKTCMVYVNNLSQGDECLVQAYREHLNLEKQVLPDDSYIYTCVPDLTRVKNERLRQVVINDT
jgi:hypothetical protein